MTPSPEFSLGSAAAECLVAGAETLQVPLDAHARTALLCYLSELRRWNGRFNLTAVTDPVDMVQRHLLDSMSVLPAVRDGGGPIVDLGSGAGLPGVVLALFRPRREVVMVDSVAKKIRFIVHASLFMGLENAHAVHGRCEGLTLPRPVGLTISRAVATPERILAWSERLLHETGCCLVMTGQPPRDSSTVSRVSGWSWDWRPLTVPGLDSRGLLIAAREA